MAPRGDVGLPSNCLVAYDLGLTFAFLFYFKKNEKPWNLHFLILNIYVMDVYKKFNDIF